jgi:hypothetical protein
MAILSQEELKSVVAAGQDPAVSIFMPTHRAGQEIRQDPIRLKNLLKQAEDELAREGSRPAEARELLAPIAALLEDAAFWRHQGEGLAIFRSPDVFRVYRLPMKVHEFVTVSDRFYVKPLVPLLTYDARFYILALSQQAVRLLECSLQHVQEVELADVPQGVQEALPTGPTPDLQKYTRPVGARTERVHGHGVGVEDNDLVNLTRYFHRVDDGLRPVLSQADAPLILACVEHLAPVFKEVASYRHILEELIPGNPDGVPNEELHRKAWQIAEPYFQQARAMAAAQYHEGITKGRAGHSLADVLAAAHQGRIASLFIPLGVRRWGRFRSDDFTVDEHAEEQPGDEELLDLAAVQTLVHGGALYGVAPEEIPGKQLLAAVYRF